MLNRDRLLVKLIKCYFQNYIADIYIYLYIYLLLKNKLIESYKYAFLKQNFLEELIIYKRQ